jgi:hypothetical protein
MNRGGAMEIVPTRSCVTGDHPPRSTEAKFSPRGVVCYLRTRGILRLATVEVVRYLPSGPRRHGPKLAITNSRLMRLQLVRSLVV